MMTKHYITAFVSLFILSIFTGKTYGQEFKHRGFSYYKTYDESFTSPESRHKKGISISALGGVFTNQVAPYRYTQNLQSNPLGPDSIVNRQTDYFQLHGGVSIGFHYMFLKRKKLTLYKKERNEFNAFNLYFTPFFAFVDTSDIFDFNGDQITHNNEKYISSYSVLRLTYTTPYLSYRGKLLNFYFFSEFGVNLSHRNKVLFTNPNDKKFKTFFTFDPLRLKLGKGKMFFTSTVNVAFDNTPIQPNKIEANFNAGIKLYLFKEK